MEFSSRNSLLGNTLSNNDNIGATEQQSSNNNLQNLQAVNQSGQQNVCLVFYKVIFFNCFVIDC